MLENPEVIDTAAHEAAVIPFTIPRTEMMHVMRPAIEELVSVLHAQGIGPAGPMFAHHFKITATTFDFEVGFPVTRPVAPTGRVKASRLPAAKRVARATYVGPYEGLPGVWGEFESWLKSHGHETGATLWEIYARGPESGGDPSTYRTELYRPLVR